MSMLTIKMPKDQNLSKIRTLDMFLLLTLIKLLHFRIIILCVQKNFRKTNISYPPYPHVRILFFSENFAYAT